MGRSQTILWRRYQKALEAALTVSQRCCRVSRILICESCICWGIALWFAWAGLSAAEAAAAVQQAAQPGPVQFDPQTEALRDQLVSNQRAILWTAVVGVLSTIVGLWFQYIRESRQRKWDLEDRRLARDEAREAAKAVNETAVATAVVAKETAAHLEKKLDTAVAVNVEAIEKSNDVNAKLARIGRAIAEAKPTAEGGRRATDKIAEAIGEVTPDAGAKP